LRSSSYVTRSSLIVALVVLTLWIAIAIVLQRTRDDTLAAAAAMALHASRVIAEYEASSLRAIDLSLRQLRADWQRDPKALDQSVAAHEAYLEREGLVQVAIVGADGWTRYSRLPLEKPLNFTDRDYFQEQKASGRDEMRISAPIMGRITKRWAIQISRPIYDAKGDFDGLIVAAMPPPALESMYREFRLGEDDLISLVRSDGVLLARTRDLDRAANVSLAGIPGLAPESPADGTYQTHDSRIDRLERLIAWRKVRGYPLTVYVVRSMDEVLAPYYRQRALLLAGGLLGSLLLLLLARVASSRRALRAELAERDRRTSEERERLMLDLHDGSIQSIYAVGMTLETARRQIDVEPRAARRTIADAVAHLNLVIQDLRSFIAGHAGRAHSQGGFMAEVQNIVSGAAAGAAPPAFALEIDAAAVQALSPEQARHVLRITREGVSNVVRHAGAGKAHISLTRAPPAGVRLEISDDGVGMAAAAERSPGLGLHHIRARGQKLGGGARVESEPGRGTRIIVEFPAFA
jgi:signal transduction histidine kinase